MGEYFEKGVFGCAICLSRDRAVSWCGQHERFECEGCRNNDSTKHALARETEPADPPPENFEEGMLRARAIKIATRVMNPLKTFLVPLLTPRNVGLMSIIAALSAALVWFFSSSIDAFLYVIWGNVSTTVGVPNMALTSIVLIFFAEIIIFIIAFAGLVYFVFLLARQLRRRDERS